MGFPNPVQQWPPQPLPPPALLESAALRIALALERTAVALEQVTAALPNLRPPEEATER